MKMIRMLWLVLLALIAGTAEEQHRHVFVSHDGGIDDYLALLLVAASSQTAAADDDDDDKPWILEGVAITGADGFVEPATSISVKLLDLVYRSVKLDNDKNNENKHDDNEECLSSFNREEKLCQLPFLFSIGGARPFHSSFPDAWRRVSVGIDLLPVLNQQYHCFGPKSSFRDRVQPPFYNLKKEAAHVLESLCCSNGSKRIWLETGPLTLLAQVIRLQPTILESCVTQIYWMGGALSVAGNVHPSTIASQDGSAEWNSFWDPPAVKEVFEAVSNESNNASLVMVPIDVCQQYPVTRSYVLDFAKRAAAARGGGQHRSASLYEFAGAAYSFAHHATGGYSYFLWDVLTAAAMLRPDLTYVEPVKVSVTLSGPAAGQISPCNNNTVRMRRIATTSRC